MTPGNHVKRLYLDIASAMPVRECAREAMRAALDITGNPGAIHGEGVAAKQALEAARTAIAREIAVKPRELIFTSGLSESDNLAIVGLARAKEAAGTPLSNTHWITTAIEHDAVLQCFAEIERLGGRVSHIDPDERGRISEASVLSALTPETVLVSIGWANSETGTVQPLRDIARAVKSARPDVLVHSDAGQAPLYLAAQPHSLAVDLLALGSNKIGGPHGIGALFIANEASVRPVLLGGAQERGLRAGTESVELAAGFAAAFAEAASERESESRQVLETRRALMHALESRIPGLVINTDLKHSLPHMLNVSVPNIQSEYVVLGLDSRGIAISTKSACREGEFSFSHVVRELGGPDWRAQNTLRFSLTSALTQDDVEHVATELADIVGRSV